MNRSIPRRMNTPTPIHNECPRKIPFARYVDALNAEMETLKRDYHFMMPYHCVSCNQWHLTNKISLPYHLNTPARLLTALKSTERVNNVVYHNKMALPNGRKLTVFRLNNADILVGLDPDTDEVCIIGRTSQEKDILRELHAQKFGTDSIHPATVRPQAKPAATDVRAYIEKRYKNKMERFNR